MVDLQGIQEARDDAIQAVLEIGSFQGDPVIEEYTWHQNEDNSVKRMVPTSEGFCFLTRAAGNFNGGGEWLQIDQEDGYWVLRGRGARREFNIQGTARCWRFPWVG